MTTQLSEQTLVQLRAEAYVSTQDAKTLNPHVDPTLVYRCAKVLDHRGEVWAADVCGRDLRERAALRSINRPALREHEPLLLVLADQAEDKAVLGSIR